MSDEYHSGIMYDIYNQEEPMSSRTETLTARYGTVDYRILPPGILQVPVDPARKELSLRGNRDQVAEHNTDPKHIEGTLWGSPYGCHTENPNFIIHPQRLTDGRVMAAGQPAPYVERAVLTVATPRPQIPRETLLADRRIPVETTLAGDLPEDTRRAYTALKLAGFETAAQETSPTATPIAIEHHVPFVSNGRTVCRTVPDPHSTCGIVDNPQMGNYEMPKAHTLEQELLTPELVTVMSVTLQSFLRDALREQRIDPDRIQVVPHVEEPRGPCIQYEDITRDNLTDPESVNLVTAVSKTQLNGYRKAIFPILGEVVPAQLQMKGDTFTPLKDPAYREIMHLSPKGRLSTALSPIIVYSPVGGMEACGITIERGAEYPRRHTEETIYQYRQANKRNMEKALTKLC